MSARIGPGSVRDLGPLRWGFARAAGRVTGTEAPAIFTTLGRTKGLFTGWLHFAGRLMPFGSLARRESEMVILAVAHARGCDYCGSSPTASAEPVSRLLRRTSTTMMVEARASRPTPGSSR